MASTLTVQTASFDTDLYDDTYRTYYGTLDTVVDRTAATLELDRTEATLTVEVADGN